MSELAFVYVYPCVCGYLVRHVTALVYEDIKELRLPAIMCHTLLIVVVLWLVGDGLRCGYWGKSSTAGLAAPTLWIPAYAGMTVRGWLCCLVITLNFDSPNPNSYRTRPILHNIIAV